MPPIDLDIRSQMKLEFGVMLKQLGHIIQTEAAAGRHDLALSRDYAKMIEDAFEARMTAFYRAAFHEGYKEGRRREERYWRDRQEKPDAND